MTWLRKDISYYMVLIISRPEYLKDNGEMGRSLGCAAMPNAMSPKIIKTIKNGSCLFIYHPTANYLTHSNVING